MSAVEGVQLEVVQEDVMSKEEVEYSLIAIGVNTCFRSYDNRHKELVAAFMEMPLSEISKSWDYLDQNVKIGVLDKHSEEFKRWIQEA